MAGKSDAKGEGGKGRSDRKRTIRDGRILVNIPPDVSACLVGIAQGKGLSPTTLVRMWLFERLAAEAWPRERIVAEYGNGDGQEAEVAATA